MATLTVRIPDEMRRALQEISAQRKVPVSALVRESLSRYVMIERFRLRTRVVPFAEAQGLLTDEDAFPASS